MFEQMKTDINNCVFYSYSFSVFQKTVKIQIIHLILLTFTILIEALTRLILVQWLTSAVLS